MRQGDLDITSVFLKAKAIVETFIETGFQPPLKVCGPLPSPCVVSL